MINSELITLASILLFTSALAYKSSFLHNKKIGYISLLQVFYLVLLPGFIYTIFFFHLLDILERPLNSQIFLSDKLLISFLLLSILYTYGGIVIHGVCKTLSSYFRKKDEKSLIFKVNNHLHRSFSHNLVFSGTIVSAACFSLLELNHLSPYPQETKIPLIVLTGVFIGLASILGLNWYKERWSELKLVFLAGWTMLVIISYAVKPYLKKIKTYPFTLSILIAFSLLAGLTVFLYVKRHKNKIKFIWRMPKKLLD